MIKHKPIIIIGNDKSCPIEKSKYKYPIWISGSLKNSTKKRKNPYKNIKHPVIKPVLLKKSVIFISNHNIIKKNKPSKNAS